VVRLDHRLTADVQPGLAIKREAPTVDPAEVDRVVEILRIAGTWMTAAEIADCMTDEGRGAPGADRRVRAIAAGGRPRILSHPGSQGYRLFAQATMEEIDHCITTWRAIRVDATETEVAYTKAYHARGLF